MAEPLSTGWYYLKSGAQPNQQAGPLTWEQLYGLASSGSLQPADMVWHQSMPQWLPASQVPGLLPAPAPSPVYQQAPYQPPPYQQQPYQPGPYQQARYQPGPYQQPAYPQAGQQPWQGYIPAAQKRTSVAAWLIPLIALILVGGGLGAYFGFFYNKGGAIGASELVGHWEGNITYESMEFKDATADDLARRDQILNKSIPATLDVTLDSGVSSLAQLSKSTNSDQKTASGTAELTMDLSAVDETLGTITNSMTFTYSDGRLTFASTDPVEGSESVTASVSRGGDLLTMKGSLTFEDDTSSGKASWKVSMESTATPSTQADGGDGNDSTDSTGDTGGTDAGDGSGAIVPTDLNGTWSGTLTITSYEGDPWAERGLTASLLGSITGLPIPVSMEISVDESGTGTGSMVVEATAIGAGFDIGTEKMAMTSSGTELTFEPASWPWGVPTMTAQVTGGSGSLSIDGVFSYSSASSSFEATFSVTK